MFESEAQTRFPSMRRILLVATSRMGPFFGKKMEVLWRVVTYVEFFWLAAHISGPFCWFFVFANGLHTI